MEALGDILDSRTLDNHLDESIQAKWICYDSIIDRPSAYTKYAAGNGLAALGAYCFTNVNYPGEAGKGYLLEFTAEIRPAPLYTAIGIEHSSGDKPWYGTRSILFVGSLPGAPSHKGPIRVERVRRVISARLLRDVV